LDGFLGKRLEPTGLIRRFGGFIRPTDSESRHQFLRIRIENETPKWWEMTGPESPDNQIIQTNA